MLLRSVASTSRSVISPAATVTRSFATTSRQCAPKSNEKKAEARSRAILRNKLEHTMSIHDAADVLRAVEVGKPGSAYELSIVTHHPKGSAAPRGRVALPKDPRTGKEILLVFAEGRAAETAKKLGANYVGAEELIKPIMDGTILPTKVICTPSVLPKINKLARVLGPKGLMPSPRRGTVTDDIAGMIRSMAGTLDWKGDKEGVVRVAIGRLNYTPEELEKNVSTFVEHVRTITAPKDDLLGNKKASSVPSVLRVFLGSTRGPGIPLAI